MKLDRNTALISILGLLFLFCVLLLVLKHNVRPATLLLPGLATESSIAKQQLLSKLAVEGFQNNDLSSDLKAKLSTLKGSELDTVLDSMKDKLESYGLLPEAAAKDIDMSNYVPKSNIPPAGPRVDMSQYVKKSSIPPEKVCPPQKEIDYSQYVKKSTIPPAQKCPPCIAPKVQVSAGLCKKCPPCPACPPPQRCPELKCPEPAPCPKVECPKCSEIKYIKVPTVITRTIKMDSNNNVVSDETIKDGLKMLSSIFSDDKEENDYNDNEMNNDNEIDVPGWKYGMNNNKKNNNNNDQYIMEANSPTKTTTTKAAVEAEVTNKAYAVPSTTRAENKAKKCDAVGLNSDFRKFGVYGLE